MDFIDSIEIETEPKCDMCGKKDSLMHIEENVYGTIIGLHCDNCCEKMITLWESNGGNT